METLFKIAEASAHGILYFMGLLSLISVSIMVERFLFLRTIGSTSSGMADKFRTVIAG